MSSQWMSAPWNRLGDCRLTECRLSDRYLCGLPQTLLSKVQRVQNAAARLVCLTGRWEHITPVGKELHWLPVRQRIQFKVLPWRNEIHDLMNIHEHFMNMHEQFMNGNHIWFMN